MAVAAVVVLPIGLLFLLSGLIVNLIQGIRAYKNNRHINLTHFTYLEYQALVNILVRPLSKSSHRRINRVLAELLWLEVVWLFDWWANIKHQYASPGKEHALVICNHKSDIDWLVGWVLAQRSGCLGSALAIVKKSTKYLPVIGWSMWFSEYIFLDRSWTKDENRLKSGLQQLCDFPQPFWLALLPEGTRFTRAKLVAAQEYAASAGLPVPRNVLIPRTKGFVAAVSHLHSFVPAIYNISVDIPKSESPPTMLRMFRRQSSVVHMHIKRHLMEELPETESGIAQWCRDVFVEKDALLELHAARGTFGDKECQDIGRPKKSLFVVISWSCLLIFGAVVFFRWCPFSSREKALCAVLLALVMILMQILIMSSQSENSTPTDALNQTLLQK
ncbi:hypothetical protein RJ639_018427 [Escallonia herrerae]|uniref:1-acylglycerol-3-phosphate O-acyltransferase n=1 Tax=Escallonia herrerae TaxID=1293975 RepID=A0AA89AKS9_9ASTE|nr:hypothetical protein RJ639_018427 [Escallonia herrerae]